MENNIKKIREACIAANPSIKDLEVGSIAFSPVTKGKEMVYIGCYPDVSEWGNGEYMYKFAYYTKGGYEAMNLDGIEIIGRPIRLADVLLAINSSTPTDTAYAITESGGFLQIGDSSSIWERLDFHWNLLKDDLTLQSPETISFIAELLSSN